MKGYSIVMRNGTVINSHYITACNSRRARRYVHRNYTDYPGWYLYSMVRVL